MRTLISVRADFFLIHSHVDPGKSTSLEDIPVPEEVSYSNVFVGKLLGEINNNLISLVEISGSHLAPPPKSD